MKPIIAMFVIAMALPANAEEYVIEVGELILDCGSKCPVKKKRATKAKKAKTPKVKSATKPALVPQVKAVAPKAKVETVKKPAALVAPATATKPAPVVATRAVAPAQKPCDEACKNAAAAKASAFLAEVLADRAKASATAAEKAAEEAERNARTANVPHRTFHLATTLGVAGAWGTTAGDGGMAPIAITIGWWLNDSNLIAIRGFAQRNFAAQYKDGVYGFGGSIRYLHEVNPNIRLGAQVGPEFLTANAGSGEGGILQLTAEAVAQFKWAQFVIEISAGGGSRHASHFIVGRTGAKAIESGPVGKVGIAFGWSHDFFSGGTKKEGK